MGTRMCSMRTCAMASLWNFEDKVATSLTSDWKVHEAMI